jgi:SAM-dependent methyltransferase
VIEGYVDVFAFPVIRGWARDTEQPDRPVEVEVVVDGNVVARGICNRERGDLSEAALGACAFEVCLEGECWSDGSQVVSVRPVGSKVALNQGVYKRVMPENMRWQEAWTRPETLRDLNRRIHDGVGLEKLYERAASYHHNFFARLFPGTSPGPGSSVLDVGSGVGWPLQALIDRIPGVFVTGLDISEVMAERAKERLSSLPNAERYLSASRFQLYDGETFPFSDGTFDAAYSYACLWHIPELRMFRIVREMLRTVKDYGRVFLHFLDVHNMPLDFANQYSIQVAETEGHWHLYHSPEKLALMAVKGFGAKNFDIRLYEGHYYVTFTKRGEKDFARPEFAQALDALLASLSVPDEEGDLRP